MKLSDFKNEDALDLIADLIEPASEIFSDKAIAEAGRSGQKAKAIKIALKEHKKSVIEILSALDNVPVSEYNKNVAQMTVDLLDLLNDDTLMQVFTSQGQKVAENVSGSAMENTEETEAE